MKNFFKKLAFVLALAMVVTAIAPAATASAAKAPVLNTTGKKLYLEKDVATGKYTNTFTLKVWNKGDYRVTFTSKNPEIATVSKWWGSVTAVAPGEATIVATVSNKTTGKVVKTLTSKVWVKRNAVEIGVSSASAGKLDNALNVGDKVKLNVFRKDLNGKTAWQQADKTIVTDYTIWTSSDTSVATVDKWGTVKAVAPGTAKITVRTAQTEDASKATANVVELNVTVKSKGITGVTQTTSNTIEVTFGSEMDTVVNKDTLEITPASSTYQTPIIKSIKWNSDKTVATVVTYSDFEDGVAYTLSVKDNADIAGEFKASVGKVASIVITGPNTALENSTPVEIEYDLKDANGVKVSAASDARVEFEIVDGDQNGYLTVENGVDKIGVFEKGKTVAVKATYYTGTFTEEGTEVSFTSNTFVVKGISATDVTLTSTKYTVTNEEYSKIDWNDVNADVTIGLNDADYSIHANVKDSADNTFKTDSDANTTTNFTFESMDTSKVEVDALGKLYPIAKGTAYVKVTVNSNEKTFLVKVTIGEERKATTLTLDKYTDTASNAVAVDDEVTFTATVKDQYGAKYKTAFEITANGNTSSEHENRFDVDGNKIVFDPAGLAAGSYSFKVTVNNLTRVVTIVVKQPGEATTTRFVVSDKTLDLAVTNSDNKAKDITFALYSVDAKGVKVAKISPENYSLDIKAPSGEVKAVADNNGYKVTVRTVTDSAISQEITKTGTYVVTVKEGTKVISKANFVITNSQVKPIVSQEATSVTVSTGSSLATILSENKVFSVSTKNTGSVSNLFAGIETVIVSSSNNIEKIDANTVLTAGTYKIVVKSVDVKETFDNGNFFIHEGINVSKTVTITVK